MTRILWAVPVSDMGGVARHVRDVFAEGVPGCALSLLVPPGPLADLATASGHEVITAPFGPAHGLVASLRSLRRARQMSRAAIVHSHLAYADFVSALSPMRTVARISTEHGIAADDRVYHASRVASRSMELAHRLRLWRLDALIAVSHATQRAIQQKWHPPSRLAISVIANGIDPSGPDVRPPGPGLHIAALARLAPEKGLVTLVDAFALVHADHGDARLTIAGQGPLRSEIERRSAQLGIADAVECVGFVDGIRALAPVHVLVQLSLWENCSYALLDALVAGCGVVATDVGGNPEILPPMSLVAVGDTADAARRIVAQGLDVDQRPDLRDGWPSVRDMCASLAATYERIAA